MSKLQKKKWSSALIGLDKLNIDSSDVRKIGKDIPKSEPGN